ncbi:MAG: hypothetical protein Terrestrivirus3_33 [Terrestrivirus sp.]|uniref:Uncharacterized protein n=1 Tax=Terrestrivirus sp. TaxID=2487775 RepID=A0A3G4ZMX8_9VIRU|nr:MAG: hypothetical protein Terrestrivirus3_33 [Terrestrivirus sp.]
MEEVKVRNPGKQEYRSVKKPQGTPRYPSARSGPLMNYECTNKCNTCPSIGSFNRLTYDNCAYTEDLHQSTSPLLYQMSRYKFENCSACTYDGTYYAPFDLVDYESELKNITRPGSLCSNMKYSPTCKKSELCTSTFDPSVPIVYAPDVCPVVCNNIRKVKSPGYRLENSVKCPSPNIRNSALRMKKSERPQRKQGEMTLAQKHMEEENALLRQVEEELMSI